MSSALSEAWLTVFSKTVRFNPASQTIGISGVVQGATDVRIEYVLQTAETPLHRTQFARTTTGTTHPGDVCGFEAQLHSAPDQLRKRVRVPALSGVPPLDFAY